MKFLMNLTAERMPKTTMCSLWQVILARILKAKSEKNNLGDNMLQDNIHKIQKDLNKYPVSYNSTTCDNISKTAITLVIHPCILPLPANCVWTDWLLVSTWLGYRCSAAPMSFNHYPGATFCSNVVSTWQRNSLKTHSATLQIKKKQNQNLWVLLYVQCALTKSVLCFLHSLS